MSDELENDPLRRLQLDLVSYLLGNPTTAEVSYASFRKLVAEESQAEAEGAWKVRVEGKTGVACLVLMPSLASKYPNVPGPQYELEVVVRTFENPEFNTIGLSAEAVGLQNLTWLDGLIIEDCTILYANPKGPALRPNYDFPGQLVYDSVLRGEFPQDWLGRTPEPTMSDDGAGTVTLACSDAAAGLYYTTDGSGPEPGAASQVYAAPFVVADGAVVRVVAWSPALLPSHVVKGTVSFEG